MNKELLKSIANASANNQPFYVTQAEAGELAKAGYISVDTGNADPNDPSKRAASITAEGVKVLSETPAPAKEHASQFSVQSGIVLPKIKRGGGGGAPTKYPFDTMNVGDFFFVANSATKEGNAAKTLASATGAANQRYMEETGEMKEVTRTKRDKKNKAVIGADGKPEKETVTLPVKKSLKHFTVRPVEANKSYGSFTAPADGAVVVRES